MTSIALSIAITIPPQLAFAAPETRAPSAGLRDFALVYAMNSDLKLSYVLEKFLKPDDAKEIISFLHKEGVDASSIRMSDLPFVDGVMMMGNREAVMQPDLSLKYNGIVIKFDPKKNSNDNFRKAFREVLTGRVSQSTRLQDFFVPKANAQAAAPASAPTVYGLLRQAGALTAEAVNLSGRLILDSATGAYRYVMASAANTVRAAVVAEHLLGQPITRPAQAVANGARSVGQSVSSTARVTAEGARATGQAIAQGARATGQSIAHGARATGQAASSAASTALSAAGRAALIASRFTLWGTAAWLGTLAVKELWEMYHDGTVSCVANGQGRNVYSIRFKSPERNFGGYATSIDRFFSPAEMHYYFQDYSRNPLGRCATRALDCEIHERECTPDAAARYTDLLSSKGSELMRDAIVPAQDPGRAPNSVPSAN